MKNYFKKAITDIISDIPKINDDDKFKLIVISVVLGLGLLFALCNKS